MELAISNYRKAAEKTFMHTMPDKEFRNMNDESIGNIYNLFINLLNIGYHRKEKLEAHLPYRS